MPLRALLLKQAGQQARNTPTILLAGIVILLSLITNQRPTRNQCRRLAREGLSKAPSSRSAPLLKQRQRQNPILARHKHRTRRKCWHKRNVKCTENDVIRHPRPYTSTRPSPGRARRGPVPARPRQRRSRGRRAPGSAAVADTRRAVVMAPRPRWRWLPTRRARGRRCCSLRERAVSVAATASPATPSTRGISDTDAIPGPIPGGKVAAMSAPVGARTTKDVPGSAPCGACVEIKARLGPNGLKIEKETTHVRRWREGAAAPRDAGIMRSLSLRFSRTMSPMSDAWLW